MNSYFLGLYEKSMPGTLSLTEKLIETKKAGFDFLEISIDETDEKLNRLKWGKVQKAELLSASMDLDMKIMSMCLSGHRKYPLGSEEKMIREKGMEIMADAIRFAYDLGIRIIQIAGYDEYYNPSNEATGKFFLENLRRSIELASRMGVVLAFETMETEFMNTVAKAMHYVKIIDSPYLQVYPDLGNITNAALLYGHGVADDLLTGKGHISALHLKETIPGKFREIPYGAGHVEFEEAIKVAMKMGVKLYLAEFWCSGTDNWQEQLKFANEFLSSKFEKLF